jgi:ribosome-associated heat shock protein Hsp15
LFFRVWNSVCKERNAGDAEGESPPLTIREARCATMQSMNNVPASESVRLDLWLWAARFFKTRAIAKQAIETGKIEIDGQRAKPSRGVRIGDALKITRGEEIFEVEVRVLSDVRGPASIARTLYAETETSRLRRESDRALRAAERAGYRAPETKPDKRARRLIRALGDIDAT